MHMHECCYEIKKNDRLEKFFIKKFTMSLSIRVRFPTTFSLHCTAFMDIYLYFRNNL